MQYPLHIDGRKRVYALKKLFPNMTYILLGVVAGAAVSLVLYIVTDGAIYSGVSGLGSKETPATSAELIDMAGDVLIALKEGDYQSLGDAVHPEFGVVFSPYATVTLSTNKCFTGEQVRNFAYDTKDYLWGIYDGKGDPIQLSPRDYFTRFVFDKDFTKAPLIGVDRVVKSGNALENFREEFPNARFVDFHVPGDDDVEDLGWSSLRLGFELYRGQYKLTVILHSEWTV